MPTYVYRCKKCQRDIEVIQRFSDEPLTTCEYCGGELQRLLFSPAIIFKGSGWYCKDNPRSTTGGNGSSLKNRETADKESASGGNGSSPEAKSTAAEPKNAARESKVSVEEGK